MIKKLAICPFCQGINTKKLYDDADDDTLEVWYCNSCKKDSKIKKIN
jgi:hypothetical protein